MRARSTTLAMAAGLAGALALWTPAGAGAARVDLDNREYAMHSGGGAIWDAVQQESSSCTTDTSNHYSPAGDGWILGGGSWRWDGFDEGLVIVVEGEQYADADGKVTVRGNSITTDPANTGGLSVQRFDSALRSGPALRSLVRLRAPGGAAFNGTVTLDSDLGSDGGEDVQATSSGDTSFTTSDRWLVTSVPPPLSTYDDPALTHVLAGKGANEKPADIPDLPGAGCLAVDFDLTIPAGKTRYLLFYSEMNLQPGRAASGARRYDKAGLSRSLLSGIGRQVRQRIVNWGL